MTSENKDKCCGSCRFLEHVDADGWGYCDARWGWRRCSECCEEYEPNKKLE